MNIQNYFIEQEGVGVLSTADHEGRVNSAIYARPHVMEDGSLAMIMRERRSHKNLQKNDYAAYLFMEKGQGYRGVRLSLKKIREDDSPELIQQMTRRCLSPEEDNAKGPKFIVYFAVENVRNLIGDGTP
jgi:hypothetical protein